MSNKGWFTMKEVMNDLAEVTGSRIKSFDSKFAVSGEQPPPVNVPDEVDDFLLMYKNCISNDTTRAEPDIAGIKHMLRMVNDYVDDSTYDDNENIRELKKNANTVLSISKLNPNVSEFVPRGMASTDHAIKGNTALIKESINNVIPKEEQKVDPNDNLIRENTDQNENSTASKNSHIEGFDLDYSFDCESLVCKDNIKMSKTGASHWTNASQKTSNNDIDINKKIDISVLNLEEIKSMREKVKLKIINTSKADCLRKKHEKNLAIASLLKLYAEIPSTSIDSKSVKLMTPDFFKTAPEDNLRTNNDYDKTKAQHNGQNSEDNAMITLSDKLSNIKKAKTLDNTNNARYLSQETQELSFSATTQVQYDKNDFTNNRTTSKGVPNQHNSMEIKTSQKKVSHFINEPEKKKNKLPAVFLGPVNFNRKEATLVPQSVDVMKTSLSPLTPDSFVISSYNDKSQCDALQCNAKKISLTNELVNVQKIVNKVDEVSQSHKFNIYPSTQSHSTKTDFSNCISPDRAIEPGNIDHHISMEIKESIKKVNRWLEPEKHKHKSPVLFLGPVTFKRKESTSVPQSVTTSETPLDGLQNLKKEETMSVSESVDKPERSSSATSNTFVPSSYADELTKSYMERSKFKEARSEDIWTKLERQLKEKDQVIKEKMNQEVQQCL